MLETVIWQSVFYLFLKILFGDRFPRVLVGLSQPVSLFEIWQIHHLPIAGTVVLIFWAKLFKANDVVS